MADLTKLTPPKELSETDRLVIFDHFFRRLASHRNTAGLYALTAHNLSHRAQSDLDRAHKAYSQELNQWAQDLLQNAWIACQEPGRGNGECPVLDPLSDTSTGDLSQLPDDSDVLKILNMILFLHLTTSKQYSAHTRSFLTSFGDIDERAVVLTLKNPEQAIKTAEHQTRQVREKHAQEGKVLRMAGMGLGALAGGVLIGVTGGLAAPLVGAGVTTVLGWIGLGGTTAGLLAGGLASSSVVCGALFGAYGAKSTAGMVERHTREIRDIAIMPVSEPKAEETLAVRLCASGWLSSREDVTAPWKAYSGDDTFALQWEVEALENLSNALMTLVKTQAMLYVKTEVIKRTIFASLMASLSPIAWLKIGRIIDNPWMNAKALAIKAGAVLGTLLSQRVFGKRPVSLTGYSLGSLVIFEALKRLSILPPADTIHLIQDVFLFGTPVSTDPITWSIVRSLVAGRLVNGYAKNDYVLAVLSRASDASWEVAGLQAVEVKGVENVECTEVDGHLQWRVMVGKCLEICGASGIVDREVDMQVQEIVMPMEAS